MTPSRPSSLANQEPCRQDGSLHQQTQNASPRPEETRPQPGDQPPFSLTSAVNDAHLTLTALPRLYAANHNPENPRYMTQRSLQDILQEALDIIGDDDMDF